MLGALTPRLMRLRRHGGSAPLGITAAVAPPHTTSSLHPLRDGGWLLQLLGGRCQGTEAKPPCTPKMLDSLCLEQGDTPLTPLP